jgi:hypothetical protein
MPHEPISRPHRDYDPSDLQTSVIALGCLAAFVFLVLFAWRHFSTERDRAALIGWLHASTKEYRVVIDGQPVADAGAIVTALRAMKAPLPHHSGPTEPFCVAVESTADRRCLVLARDSSVRREYWVFMAEHGCTGPDLLDNTLADPGSEIGRVTTQALDAYPVR